MKTEAPKSRTLDVRPIIAEGGSPLEKIMAATRSLGAQDTLVLITPFLPSPMIEKLQSEGFQARPERRSDGAWQTHFVRKS